MVNGVYSTGGLQSRYLTNSYNSIAGLSNGSFGDEPLFSLGNSYGFGGFNPMMGMGMGYGMGYGPGSEVMRMSQADYQRYQEQLEQYQIGKQVRQQKAYRQADFALNGVEASINERIRILKEAIHEDEQLHVEEQYNKLLKDVRNLYPKPQFMSGEDNVAYDTMIRDKANKMFQAATNIDIATAIKQHGDSQFVHGLKRALDPFDAVTDKRSAKENALMVDGGHLSKKDKYQDFLGKAAGYAIMVGVPVLATLVLGKAGKGIAKMLKKAPKVPTTPATATP